MESNRFSFNEWMIVWCTQNLRRDGSSFTWHQPCNNQRALSVHHRYKRTQLLIENHMRHERSETALRAENSAI